MITYNKIHDAIVNYKGKIVTFITQTGSEEFVQSVLEDLKRDFKIENYTTDIKLEKLEENSILLIKYDREIDYKNFRPIIEDKNIVVIVLRNYNETTNTEISGSNDRAVLFASDLIFILKKNRLNVLKSRLSELKGNIDITQLLRSVKLKMLNKIK